MKNEKVNRYLDKQTKWKEPLTLLRNLLLQTGAKETLKWGTPVYVVNGKNIAGLASFKNHFSIWFFQGVFLKDTQHKLVSEEETTAKAMRQWRFTSVEEIDENLVLEYMEESIANAKAGKEVKPEKKKDLPMPEELQQAFNNDKTLQESFEALTPYKQKEYKEHISSAKQEKTRINCLQKCIPLILEGKGLHDKYKNC